MKVLKKWGPVIIWILLMLIFLFSISPVRGEEKFPQIVLKVTRAVNGRIYAVPRAVVEIGLEPAVPTDHYAPLPPGTNMICRMQPKNFEGHPAIQWNCGSDQYLMTAIGFVPKEK